MITSNVHELQQEVCTVHKHTDKKENNILPIDIYIQMGSGAKSYMRKDFLIY